MTSPTDNEMTHPYTTAHAAKPNAGARLAHEIAVGMFAVRNRERFPLWLRRMMAVREFPREVLYDLLVLWVQQEAPELMERK